MKRKPKYHHWSRAVWPGVAAGLVCSSGTYWAADAPASKNPLRPTDPGYSYSDKDKLKALQALTTNTPPASPALFNPDPSYTTPFPPDLIFRDLNKLPELRVFISVGSPPLAPSQFNPDPKNPVLVLPAPAGRVESRVTVAPGTVQPPAQFNPDPGQAKRAARQEESFFKDIAPTPDFGSDAVPKALTLPRNNVRLFEHVLMLPTRSYFGLDPVPSALTLPRHNVRLVETVLPKGPDRLPYGDEPLPKGLDLPRSNTRRNLPAHPHFSNNGIPRQKEEPLPPNTEAKPNRWRIGFTPWQRYGIGSLESPYSYPEPALWHPYQQSILKGDVPVIGQDIFLNLTATAVTEFEAKRIPTPSGVSAALAGQAEFFGRSEQVSIQNNLGFSIELFKGETAFKPVEWAVKIQPVYNLNYVNARETGAVSPDPRGFLGGGPGNNQPPPNNGGIQNPGDIDAILNGQLGTISDLAGGRNTVRTKDHWALQEAFFELHLFDLSPNYDFIALRAGNQTFNSDFRGFLFNETNLGARLFGNAGSNRYQYNVAAFDLREKDTNSGLNTFDARNQQVFAANLFWQDFLTRGYTAQWSLHASIDNADLLYERNRNIFRPAPFGTVRPHDVNSYYIGWAGDGHIGRLNISHQFYQAFGRDEFNGLAGKAVDINAQFAAVELSYDRDWLRYKASVVYASGDNNAEDGKGTGFDTIVDNPNFTGGPFSYYVKQGFNLGGTAVNLKQPNSLVPNLRTSKTQGQASFVNPGVFIVGVGLEADVTPKLRSFLNANYIRFNATDPIKTALLTDKIDHELGIDLSLGIQYRPFLTDNVIISAGFGVLLPGQGFKDIYRRNTDPVPGIDPIGKAGKVDDFLYSGLIAITLTY